MAHSHAGHHHGPGGHGALHSHVAHGDSGRGHVRKLRLALAVIVLLVGLRILLGLVWRPEEIFTVQLS